LVVLIAVPLRAQEGAANRGESEQYVLLRNGQLLRGHVTQSGDRIDLSLPGGEARLRATEVELVADNEAAILAARRNRTSLERVEARIDLVRWCLRQKLLESATSELAALRAMAPDHPQLKLLTDELAKAQARSNGNVSAVTVTPARPAATPRVVAGSEQVTRALRQVAQQSLVDFADEIQPILLKRCATATCHDTASATELRFMPLAGGRDREKRIGQRNLFSVLSMIDRAAPDNSPLLRAMNEPHPTAESPRWDPAEYELVVKWVHDLRGPQVASRPATLDRRRAHLMQRLEQSQVELPPAREPARAGLPRQPLAEKPRARVGAAQPPLDNELEEPLPSPTPLIEEESDPFDPSAFNRQFFPDNP